GNDFMCCFFFSSRRRHTRFSRDWSSDVCSSDLVEMIQEANQNGARLAKACEELHISVRTYERWVADGGVKIDQRTLVNRPVPKRSEERRVGKECRDWWTPWQYKERADKEAL